MKFLKRGKWLLAAAATIILLAGLFYPVRAYLWAPYQVRREAMNLPLVPAALSFADLGLPTPESAFACPDLPTSLGLAELDSRISSLTRKIRSAPEDLCAGNAFREAIRYRDLRHGSFAVNISALPAALAAIAKDPDSKPAEQAYESKRAPDELEPASLFHDLVSHPETDRPETQLQLGLSYVDLMIRQGGRENKARLSSRSIEALSAALDQRPYMIAALYARGLNHLYWPIIAGKLPLAVGDLKTCIALSKLPMLRDNPPLVVAEAYTALGDSLVKLSDSSWDAKQREALLSAARDWWLEGASRFPGYRGFDARLKVAPPALPDYIDSVRGLETYINTDLDLLWTR